MNQIEILINNAMLIRKGNTQDAYDNSTFTMQVALVRAIQELTEATRLAGKDK